MHQFINQHTHTHTHTIWARILFLTTKVPADNPFSLTFPLPLFDYPNSHMSTLCPEFVNTKPGIRTEALHSTLRPHLTHKEEQWQCLRVWGTRPKPQAWPPHIPNHSCIAMGPQIEYSFIWQQEPQLLRCCLQRSVLNTWGRWEADMSSQSMSHPFGGWDIHPHCATYCSKKLLHVINWTLTAVARTISAARVYFLPLICIFQTNTN